MLLSRTRARLSDPGWATIVVVATLGFVIVSLAFISIIQTDQSEIGATITITTSVLQQSTTTSSSGAVPAGAQVTMPNGVGGSPLLDFLPKNITVVIGVNNTVTWTNADSAVHTVTSKIVPKGAASFSSANMAPGAVFTYTFTTPGYYTYYCVYHSWMAGSVTVVAK